MSDFKQLRKDRENILLQFMQQKEAMLKPARPVSFKEQLKEQAMSQQNMIYSLVENMNKQREIQQRRKNDELLQRINKLERQKQDLFINYEEEQRRKKEAELKAIEDAKNKKRNRVPPPLWPLPLHQLPRNVSYRP